MEAQPEPKKRQGSLLFFSYVFLPEVIALYEAVAAAGGVFPAAKVVGIALHCPDMDDTEARRVLADTEAETGLPTTDVVRFGAVPLLDALL